MVIVCIKFQENLSKISVYRQATALREHVIEI